MSETAILKLKGICVQCWIFFITFCFRNS